MRARALRPFLLATLTTASLLAPASHAAPSDRKISDAGPEAALQVIFGEIETNRLDAAFDRTEALLQAYPNFRLAHLIKGDLLLARARPLAAFGNADGGEPQLEGLREEAAARLRAYQERPRQDYVPRYLLQMERDQRYAVVVDTKRARLYVYRNDNGKPRFVADFYASHGKAGAEKVKEGDNRTPLGVYHVTSFISPARLPDFYGSGAFPINYPNDWDKRLGRTGHGIWLHGTPSDTYARPPKASEGCVVLANQDLSALANYIEPGLTPVIISNEIEWLSLDDWQAQRSSLNQAIETWRSDWEGNDVERYLSHYSDDFRGDKLDHASWMAQKRRVAANRGPAKITVDKLSMFRNPGKDEMVVVTFEQEFRTDKHTDKMRKRQYWKREGSRWKIVFEGAA
ncbi:L,D-transpeptidase family protein [Azoarcus sp. TTM-91]|uniref:L,D-transpeptidase family protein n=1 Tax=Azoarcus sp. TTM-91 TaxID=2691581 RepID=UPI00145CEA8E|nr:L,D-transpeptidase family protein [Azoarcus sp. TTM-91]NMG34170.1 L,D-transpeptidase family protein [Azoarcus sp. TTM-91]